MNMYQDKRLHDWIHEGRQTGMITDVQIVVLAYCMDEREALVWVADIVAGKVTEREAVIFMERALQYDVPRSADVRH